MNENRFTTKIIGRNYDTSYIILNAGRPRTLRSEYSKCLLKHKGKTILENQVNVIRSNNKTSDIICVCNAGDQKVINTAKSLNIRCVENPDRDSSPVESVRIGLNASRYGNVCIIHGDVVFSMSLIQSDYKNIDLPIVKSSNTSKIGVSEKGELKYGELQEWCQIAHIPHFLYDKLKEECLKKRSLTTYELLNIFGETQPITTRNIKSGNYFEITSKKDVT